MVFELGAGGRLVSPQWFLDAGTSPSPSRSRQLGGLVALASQVLCHVSSELPQRVSSVRKTLSRAEQAHLQKRCPRIALVIDGARHPLVGVRSPSALGPVQLRARRDAAGVRAPGHGHVRGQVDVLLR